MGTRSQGRAARGQADVGPPAGPVRRAVLAVDATTLRPPWAHVPERFDRACTGCAACVEACPTHVLTLVANLARIDFSDGECTFCGACVVACPEPAFDVAARAAARRPWTALARIDATCLARLGVECHSCGDACEEQAIRFRVHAGPVPDPRVDFARCTGCGACVRTCPASAIEVRAIAALS